MKNSVWETVVGIILGFFGVLIILGFLLMFASQYPALAHLHGDKWAQLPEAKQKWMRQQIVPGSNGNSCCSHLDAEETQEDIRDGHYWVKGNSQLFEEFAKRGAVVGMDENGWVPVPDEAIITAPNKLGAPVVWWWTKQENPGAPTVLYVRCFSPGALL